MKEVTIVIPTRNAGPRLAQVLDAITDQKDVTAPEVLVIDSSSEDDHTRRILRERRLHFHTIAPEEFNHGETRNAAARMAATPLVAFLSQDAVPAHSHWLRELIRPFEDGHIAASWAAQIPRPGTHPFQRINLVRHMDASTTVLVRHGFTPEEFELMSPEERWQAIRFDNVSSCIRRELLLEHPFPRREFAEDLAWSRHMLCRGYSLAFCPAARVEHSHDVNSEEFSRRVFLAHRALRELCDFLPMDSRLLQLRRCVATMLRFQEATLKERPLHPGSCLLQLVQAPWFAAMQMSAMWRGSHSASYAPPEGAPSR